MSEDEVGTDWHAWHREYDDPDSSLSRRLAVVQRWVGELLRDGKPVRTVLSLCAGDGRDVIPAVAELPAGRRPEVALVELDADLAAAAQRRAADCGVTAEVVVGDAGRSSSWQRFVPVDLLLLCGVLGNVRDADIPITIDALREVLTDGGQVIWTRGFRDDVDLRPQVRRWFDEAGFVEVGFEAEPRGFGVGVSRLPAAHRTGLIPARLFSFVR